jgi:hypothetical protein
VGFDGVGRLDRAESPCQTIEHRLWSTAHYRAENLYAAVGQPGDYTSGWPLANPPSRIDDLE